MTTRRTTWRSRKATPALPPEPESARTQRAKRLPMFGPGIVITIPLSLLPEYFELYHLEALSKAEVRDLIARGGRKPPYTLMVRRIQKTGKNTDANHPR